MCTQTLPRLQSCLYPSILCCLLFTSSPRLPVPLKATASRSPGARDHNNTHYPSRPSYRGRDPCRRHVQQHLAGAATQDRPGRAGPARGPREVSRVSCPYLAFQLHANGCHAASWSPCPVSPCLGERARLVRSCEPWMRKYPISLARLVAAAAASESARRPPTTSSPSRLASIDRVMDSHLRDARIVC